MNENKRKTPADRAENFGIQRWKRRMLREDFASIADDHYAGRFDAFGDNSRAHVFAENDHARGAAERPAMKFFPDPRDPAGFDDRASHGHVRIHVPYVVDVRLAFQQGDDRADDALKRRIGHGHDGVRRHKERTWNRQRDVAEIIQHPFFHIEARKIR